MPYSIRKQLIYLNSLQFSEMLYFFRYNNCKLIQFVLISTGELVQNN